MNTTTVKFPSPQYSSPLGDHYTALDGLIHLIESLNNGAADGTGIYKLVTFARNLIGYDLPQFLVNYEIENQNDLFGSYPTTKDKAPSAIFAAVFGVLAILHLMLFIINCTRGHYFIMSLVWFLNCLMRVVGWILRAVWCDDLTLVQLGLTDEFFLIIPSILLVSTNLILAQRLFTWRHPVGGSRKLFWGIMLALYGLVVIIIIITVFASFVPYLKYLSNYSYRAYKIIVMFSAVLIILYSLTAIALLGLSYFFKPTRKDENLYTYQPWWIESFNPTYFVKRNAAKDAEETFMKRNHNHRHAIRVIAATHHHYKMVEGLSNERGTLKHNTSLGMVCVTTLLIFIGAIGRCVVTFQHRYARDEGPASNNVFMYICWGLFEVIINLLYLVGRVDLRFYRPDVLPGKVRAIVTAEQTYYPSSEDEDEDEEYTNTLRSTSDFESFSKQSDEVDDDLDFQASNGKTKDLPYPAEDFKPDFTKPSPAYKHGTYPKDTELDEFHF
ncbi:hypothetical protein HYPBUDRAFT_102222 [Hyphopichia burtonii NRRL Y-1933]|uniref:Uncharacterized protein n=1 Tax=Hyphopichia burtonii NRRL Y-1933 TaxID=984485 RepID=A0A1E4RQJ8_9ASCO|nr:hypothetical protein HYPBUDRAFT_102222 [Hyphopichia burtonii NRRL Y-1933]ODV69552.1 hypothetical protein HYPBUDRAFT_102222 [Hyphopichia burtonii NRRL Y-1933]